MTRVSYAVVLVCLFLLLSLTADIAMGTEDSDGNGFRDHYEQFLAENFCPSLVLDARDQGVSPEPVEIMGPIWVSGFSVALDYAGEVVTYWTDTNYSMVDSWGDFDDGAYISGSPTSTCGPINDKFLIISHFDYAGPGPQGHCDKFISGATNDQPAGWRTVYANGIQNGYQQILPGDAYPHTVYAHLFTHQGADGLEYVIQYWFFYPFNDFINNHEGDWEHINVVIDSDDPCTAEITRAIYYFHESFKICEKAQSEYPNEFDFYVVGGSHPVVFVGGYGEKEYQGSTGSGPGSHGCYPVYGGWDNVKGIYVEIFGIGEIHITDICEDVHSQGQIYIPWCEIVNAKLGDSYGVVLLKEPGYYNYDVNYEMSWLAANILWGYPYVHSFCSHLMPLEMHQCGLGNEAPAGPVYSTVWQVVDWETYKFARYIGMANGLTYASDAGWTPPTICDTQPVPCDCETPEVVLYHPNGGEHYRTTQTIPITWHVDDDYLDGVVCSVALNVNSGIGSWTVLASGIQVDANGDGHYNYKVPTGNITQEHCRIRVLATDSAMHQDYDISDHDFIMELLSKPPDDPLIPGQEKEPLTAGPTESVMPKRTVLNAPYPNPFNPTTTIRFALGKKTTVSLVIYDVSGNVIKKFCHDTVMSRGEHIEMWNGESDKGARVASGIYFLHLKAGDYSETKRMILLR